MPITRFSVGAAARKVAANRTGPAMHSDAHTNTINLAAHSVRSAAFDRLYAEGMSLVDEASNYLDHAGRAATKRMEAEVAALYASESMRLTTRLMQLASWLLLQRAANNGEMTADQVSEEKAKVRLQGFAANMGEPHWADLPEEFRDMVERSLVLQRRVAYIDREANRTVREEMLPNPVASSLHEIARRIEG